MTRAGPLKEQERSCREDRWKAETDPNQTLRDTFGQEQSREYARRTAHAIAAISVGD